MPLGANVAGLPVFMGNTARSALRRAGQQAHHRRHACLHAELLENVLEMLLDCARTHVENAVRRPRARSQMLSVVTSEATRRGNRSSPELAKLSRPQASAAISFSSFKPCSAMRAARVATDSPQGSRAYVETRMARSCPSSGV